VALLNHSKTNTAFFLAEWKFKLVNGLSVSSGRTTALWGILIPSYSITIQIVMYLRELHKYSTIALM
jgi:hypothetical protein